MPQSRSLLRKPTHAAVMPRDRGDEGTPGTYGKSVLVAGARCTLAEHGPTDKLGTSGATALYSRHPPKVTASDGSILAGLHGTRLQTDPISENMFYSLPNASVSLFSQGRYHRTKNSEKTVSPEVREAANQASHWASQRSGQSGATSTGQRTREQHVLICSVVCRAHGPSVKRRDAAAAFLRFAS